MLRFIYDIMSFYSDTLWALGEGAAPHCPASISTAFGEPVKAFMFEPPKTCRGWNQFCF